MMEARIRVASGNRQQPVLSTQDVVSCSNYAQGCHGGFPYLVSAMAISTPMSDQSMRRAAAPMDQRGGAGWAGCRQWSIAISEQLGGLP